MIIMDSREKEKLKKYFGEEEVVVEALPTGDYYIKEKGLLIERKTMPDFVGSYITGHLSEQLENMSENFETYYLFISGHFNYFTLKDTPYKHITSRSVAKMKLHLCMYFPGLKIIEFDNDKQLIEMVVELQNYTGSVHHRELVRRQATSEDVHLSILTSFRGISLRKAKAITKVYDNIHKLMIGIEKSEDKKQFEISELNKKDFMRLKEYFGKVIRDENSIESNTDKNLGDKDRKKDN